MLALDVLSETSPLQALVIMSLSLFLIAVLILGLILEFVLNWSMLQSSVAYNIGEREGQPLKCTAYKEVQN